MTKREAIVLSALTGVLLCDFEDYHAYAEDLLGRPVLTHELIEEKVKNVIRELARAEAESILGNLE